VNSKTKHGLTALHYAASKGQDWAVRLKEIAGEENNGEVVIKYEIFMSTVQCSPPVSK
jgi:hypothetical protein